MRRAALAAYEEFCTLRRCPECNGRLMNAGGEETACSSCGIVAGRINDVEYCSSQLGNRDEPLGSFILAGTGWRGPARRGSVFGQTRLMPNTIGRDVGAWKCSRLIEGVSGRLMLPKSVTQNAVLTAKRLLPGIRRYGTTMAAISAYSLLYACRSAGITHVGCKEILKAYSEAGHRVGRSQLFRIWSESSLRLPKSSVEELVRGAVRKLQSNREVVERLREAGIDRAAYFARLFELAKEIAVGSSSMGGLNPRTVAAGSVYLANLERGPKVVRQREAAETLGMAEYTIREFCIRARKRMEAR